MAIALLAATTIAYSQPPPPGDIVAAGLTHPRGLSLDADGTTVIVSQVGGALTRIGADGSVSNIVGGLPTATFVSPATGGDEVGGPSSAIAVTGGYIVTLSEVPGVAEFQSVYFVDAQGNMLLLADLGAYEAANNTDGQMGMDGEPDLLSNPFDVVSDGAGGLYVSDSGANAILHIADDGTISPFAVLNVIPNPMFPGVGGPMMQQVPTGMAIGPDGALYVGTLTGFPFPQGGASVYRLEDLNDDGNAMGDGEVTVYASGLTSVTDIAFDLDGSLLVTQFSANMLGQNVLGQLVRVTGGTNEVVVDGLITPTGVVVTSDGRVLVSQEFAGLVTDVSGILAGDPPTPPAAPPPADTGNAGLVAGSTLPLGLVLLALASTAVLVARRATGVSIR